MEPKHLTTYPRINPSNFSASITGKTILITGGGRGIGASIARSFAAAGASTIHLVGRSASTLTTTASTLASAYPSTTITTHTADLASPTSTSSLFASLTTSPDILVNNAGYLPSPSTFPSTPSSDYADAFATNVTGTIALTAAFLRHRAADPTAASRGPAVVFTINTAGSYSVHLPGLSAYLVSKAALARWSELMADEVPKETARFVSVHPGAVRTEMMQRAGMVGKMPETEPELVGDFLVWASTEEAGFLGGRFVWVHWDVDELVGREGEIVEGDLLRTAIGM